MATFDERFILPTQLPELQDNRLFNDFQVTPGTKIGNILTGNNGEERFQTWPERMVRSGLALPADVYSGREPIVDDSGHTAQPVIERAMDTAGLAGMSTIGIKPGTASVGSGLIAREDSKPATALAALKSKSEQFGLTEAEYLKQLSNNEQLKIFDELDARNAKLSPTEKMHYDYLEGKLGELEAGTQPKQNLAIQQIEQTLRSDFASILPEFKTVEDVATAKKHNPNFKETIKGLTNEEAFQAIQNANDPNFKPIKLDNGLTLIPVRHNPFAELETGIREAAKNIVRDEPLQPNTAAQKLIDKRIDILSKQLDNVKNFQEENAIYDKMRELRNKRDELPSIAKEPDKIHDIALSFVDKWNPKAREKRAEAQGFTEEAYHGAKHGFESLQVQAPRGYGFYSTAHPELAEMYAGSGSYREPNLIPLKINTKEYNVVDAKGKGWEDINKTAIAKAQEEGKKGIVIHNVYDEPSSGQDLGAPKTVFITLDPTTVKSKFAKFNLEKLGFNDLLASGAALLLGNSVLDAAKKKEPKLIPVQGNPFQ